MTYPHEEPEFHKPNDLPDYLQPEHIKRVMEVNNAVMEVSLNCKEENADCLECGNIECFKKIEEVAKLRGETFHEHIQGWEKQREIDEKAAEAQTKRYEQYQRDYEQKELISKIKKSDSNERSLFDTAA